MARIIGKKLHTLHGVIFDMDGVLIDSHPVHRNAWRRFLATVGKHLTDDQLDYILQGRRREEILRHFLGDLSPEAMVEYGHRKDQFFQEDFDDVQLIPGIRQFLEALHSAKIPIGMATSASSFRTVTTLHRLNLQSIFSTVVTGDDVPAGKPDPSIYRLASERMNVLPSMLLVLEDAPCGIQAAKAAGMVCIGVASNGRAQELKRAGADHVVGDFVGFSLQGLTDLWEQLQENARPSFAQS